MGSACDQEVKGVYDIVHGLSIGIGAKRKEFEAMSGYFQQVLKRCEGFYSLEVDVDDGVAGQKKLFPRKKVVFGSVALRTLYESMEEKFAKGEDKSVTLPTLQPLKTYSWVFSEEESAQIRKWLQSVSPRPGCGGMHASIEDTQGDDKSAIVMASDIVASSSSSASSSSAGPATKKAKVAEAKVADNTSNMLKFFVKK